MKNDRKKHRVRYLFFGTLVLTLLLIMLQVYFLRQQYTNTNRLTQIVLDESLRMAVNRYQVMSFYSSMKLSLEEKNPFSSMGFKIIVNDSLKPEDKADLAGLFEQRIEGSRPDKNDSLSQRGERLDFMWSSDQKNNATAILESFLMLMNRNSNMATVNLMELDSVFSKILEEKDWNIIYSLQSIDLSTKAINDQTNEQLALHSGHLLQTGQHPVTYDKSVQMVYKNPNSVILGQMTGVIAGSAVMTILMICLLFYYIYIISKQKKIETIREDFVHSMTHELRNPLQGAIALSQMLEHEKVLRDAHIHKDALSRLQQNLMDLKIQVDTLLTLSLSDKVQTILPKKMQDVGSMLEDVINAYTLIAEKPVHFSLIIDPEPCMAAYNTTHIINAVRNLVENAIKYSKEEVTIDIVARKSDTVLRISIKDNGIGIPEKERDRIFEQYYRVPSLNAGAKASGFGLGLSYVKWVAEAHDGRVYVESKENTGSEFTIELPV